MTTNATDLNIYNSKPGSTL